MEFMRNGSIRYISMENWMAYTGPVVLTAKPGVNIIAASNGSGKSAIVCAIALSLGFDTNILSRGDNIRSFIKRGCMNSILKVGLVDDKSKGGTIDIERRIHLTENPLSKDKTNNRKSDKNDQTTSKYPTLVKNEWFLNGKSCNLDSIKSLYKRLNLQLDNLLTFLAQANVGKFAAMSQQELFRSTLNAINPTYVDELEHLIDLTQKIKSKTSESKLIEQELQSCNSKLSELKQISDTMVKVKDATLYRNVVKLKLNQMKLNIITKGHENTRKRIADSNNEIYSCESKHKKLEARKSKMKSTVDVLLKDSKNKIEEANKLMEQDYSYLNTNNISDNSGNESVDKAFYESMSMLKSLENDFKRAQSRKEMNEDNSESLRNKIESINEQIQVIQAKIIDTSQIVDEIAKCKINEEQLRYMLRRQKSRSSLKFEEMQFESLMNQLPYMKRDHILRYLKYCKTNNVNPHTIVINDVKVKGKLNCSIVEDSIGNYLDCILLKKGDYDNNLKLLKEFKLPIVTVPNVKNVMCKVTKRMKEFGVIRFVHELFESSEMTLQCLSSLCQINETFVVDEGFYNKYFLDRKNFNQKDNENNKDNNNNKENNRDKNENKQKNRRNSINEDIRSTRSSRRGSINEDSESGRNENNSSIRSENNSRISNENTNEGFFDQFYETMIEEISLQLGKRVSALKYFIGDKKHLYKHFPESNYFIDSEVTINTNPKVIVDYSNYGNQASESDTRSLEVQLDGVMKQLSELNSKLKANNDINKDLNRRLFGLSRQQISLEKSLKAIGLAENEKITNKDWSSSLEKIKATRLNAISSSIITSGRSLLKRLEKTSIMKNNLLEANDTYNLYCSQLTDLKDLTEMVNESAMHISELKSTRSMLQNTYEEQKDRIEQYKNTISEVKQSIKSSEELFDSAYFNDEEIKKFSEIKKDFENKLINFTEGELEKELIKAEDQVKQLETDDFEEIQLMKMIQEQRNNKNQYKEQLKILIDEVNKLTTQRNEKYEVWELQVNKIIKDIDNKFGKYMKYIGEGSGGQIRLDIDKENIKESKLRILVKFDKEKDLLPLTTSYQSGGERGVTTMVYILSVQNLTNNPFFVIDEINQGLDSHYEKKLMKLLLGCVNTSEDEMDNNINEELGINNECNQNNIPQYFILTPQLISGYDLRNATLHFPLNGPGIEKNLIL